jgi:hypothetical protein
MGARKSLWAGAVESGQPEQVALLHHERATPKPTKADRIVAIAAVAEITIDLKAIARTMSVTLTM